MFTLNDSRKTATIFIFVAVLIFYLMFPLKRTNKKLDIEFGKTFVLYDIIGYKFDENLNFKEDQDGVYIFTEQTFFGFNETVTNISMCHRMLYCGKTIDLRSRFDSHHHKDDIAKHKNLHIAVAYCEDENEITNLENALLQKFNFPYNDEDEGRNTGVEEPIIKEVTL